MYNKLNVYAYLGYFNKLFNESAPGSGVTDGADLTSHPVANLHVDSITMKYTQQYYYNFCTSVLYQTRHTRLHMYNRLPHWICQWKHLRFFGKACFLQQNGSENLIVNGYWWFYTHDSPGELASHMYTTSSWVSIAFNMSNSIRVSYRKCREGV